MTRPRTHSDSECSPGLLLVLALVASGCSCGEADRADGGASPDAGDAGDAGDTGPPPDASGGPCDPPAYEAPPVVCDGLPPPGVLVEEWIVATPTPPPNPATDEATPGEYDRVRVMRYRPDPPPDDVDAVLLLVPGFLAGASSFDPLARGVVVASGGTVEVWALDRRANFLEDLHGMNVSESAGNPDLASAYYFAGAHIAGVAFEGFRSQDELGFVSEWGLASFVADLRAVIGVLPVDRRATNLFVGGHSLGSALAEIYSAWDLDGMPASDELAGIVLLDGTVSGEGLDRVAYHSRGGGLVMVGLDGIRDGSDDRTASLPLVTTELLASAEILGLRAFFAPYDVVCDERLDEYMRLLYGIRPWVTGAAALGFLLDDRFAPLPILAMRIGDGAGGSFEDLEFDLGGVPISYRAPTDPDVVYHWLDHESIDPPDLGCVRSVARAQFAGPTNFAEWYFPNRLALDVAAVGDLSVSEAGGDYRLDEEGLRVTRAADMAAPVLAIAASEGVAVDAEAYEPYRLAVSPAAAFEVRVLDGYWHLDPVMSEADEPAAAIAEFLERNREGTIGVAGIGEE